MKKSLYAFFIGMLLLVSLANFVSSEAICDNEADVVLVIDHSASITPQKLSQIKNSSKDFVDLFNSSTQKIGLVQFSVFGDLLSSLTNNFNVVKNQIDTITIQAQTNMGDGIQKATEEIVDNGRNNVLQYMVLVSDGLPTAMLNQSGDFVSCASAPPASNCTNYALEKAQEAKDEGIILYTVSADNSSTFGNDFMKQVASDDSKYFSSPEFANLEEIYTQIATEICVKGADLNVWDDSDTEEILVDEEIIFYTNYTDTENNLSITNASCQIAFDLDSGYGPWNNMSYNSSLGLFSYTDSFSEDGTFDFKVTCSAPDYETLTETDNFTIKKENTEDDPKDRDKTSYYDLYGNNFCEPLWSCGQWSECDNGAKTRVCEDRNFCGTNYLKPMESAGCFSNQTEPQTSNFNWLWLIILVLMALILIVTLVVILMRR